MVPLAFVKKFLAWKKKDHGDYLQSSVHEKIKYLNEIA